jgi:hypothetical protein
MRLMAKAGLAQPLNQAAKGLLARQLMTEN